MRDHEEFCDDLLRGAEAIGKFLGLTPRQAFNLLDRGTIPAGKEGKAWIASKTSLREHYRRLASGKAA